MPPLQPTTIANIMARLDRGESSRQIASAIGVGKTTVNDWAERASIDSPRAKTGRPEKLSPRERREAARLLKTGQCENAVQVRKAMNQNRDDKVCTQTIRNALRKERFVVRRLLKKPRLTPRHRRARLDWAHKHRQWTLDDWKRVLWSDETKVNRIGSDG